MGGEGEGENDKQSPDACVSGVYSMIRHCSLQSTNITSEDDAFIWGFWGNEGPTDLEMLDNMMADRLDFSVLE